jgi:integrase
VLRAFPPCPETPLEEVRGKLTYVEETKTEASRRGLTLLAFLAEILTDHLARAVPSEYVFYRTRRRSPAALELPTSPLDPATASVGLAPLRFHDLRHTCASILVAQEAHPAEITARLGHASIVTTMNTYGHFAPGPR